jgi:hypothetical protein
VEPVRAFTIGDHQFFLGVVALLNSLRLTGNAMPLTVLDLGLTPDERRLLEPHCELVAVARGRYPWLEKPHLLARSPASVAIFVDADIIVTGSLDPVVDVAHAVGITANVDVAVTRWFAEWSELLGLRAPLRREPYVNSGFVALAPERIPFLLPRWAELCGSLRGRRLGPDSLGPDDPVWLSDQDALNALMMSEVPEGGAARAADMAIVMSKVRVDDVDRLACSLDGRPLRLLHSIGHPKPWEPRARWEWSGDAYGACLRRVLVGPDLALAVPRAMVPTWLRPGRAASVERRFMRTYDRAASWTRPWRRRVGLSPLRRRDGFVPGREPRARRPAPG